MVLNCVNKTLASIKPEISQGLTSLLDELKSLGETKVLRTFTNDRKPQYSRPRYPAKKTFKSCILCKTAGRPSYSSHSLAECKYLPEYDRRSMAKSRMTDCFDDYDEHCLDKLEDSHLQDAHLQTSTITENALLEPSTRRVNVIQSPTLNLYFSHHPIRLTIDTGATTNMVKASVAKHIGLPIIPASQMAR